MQRQTFMMTIILLVLVCGYPSLTYATDPACEQLFAEIKELRTQAESLKRTEELHLKELKKIEDMLMGPFYKEFSRASYAEACENKLVFGYAATPCPLIIQQVKTLRYQKLEHHHKLQPIQAEYQRVMTRWHFISRQAQDKDCFTSPAPEPSSSSPSTSGDGGEIDVSHPVPQTDVQAVPQQTQQKPARKKSFFERFVSPVIPFIPVLIPQGGGGGGSQPYPEGHSH